MGHVSGKLPAALLCLLGLGDVKQHHRHTGHFLRGADGSGMNFENASPQLCPACNRLAGQCLLHSLLERHVAGEHQQLRSHYIIAVLHIQQIQCCLIGRDNPAGIIQQNHALLQMADNGVQLVLLLGQGILLFLQVLLLAVNAAQQGAELVIALVFQRLVQVQLVHRLHNALGKAAGQQEGKRRCHGNHNADGLKHSHQQHKNGVVGDGQAKHRAIGQLLRRIEVLLHHGGGIAGALAIAGSQGILDFLPLQVIFHCLSIRGAVIEHLTVGRNPSHAVIAGIQAVKIGHSHALCAPDGQRRLRAELILLHR